MAEGDSFAGGSEEAFECRLARYMSASARAHNESDVSPSSGYTATPMLAETHSFSCRTAIGRSSSA